MRRATTRTLATVTALLGAVGLLAAPVEAAGDAATLHMGAHFGARVAVFADRSDLILAPGQSATVMVTVKVRMARGESLAVALDAPWDGAPVRYEFQGQAGRLAGPTTIGRVTASGAYRIPLTVTLDRVAARPVRLPLAVRAGKGTATLAATTITQVWP